MLYYPSDMDTTTPSDEYDTTNLCLALKKRCESDDKCAQYQILQSGAFNFVAGTCQDYLPNNNSNLLHLEPGKIYEIEYKAVSIICPFTIELRNLANKSVRFSSCTSTHGSLPPFIATHKLIFSPYDRVDCQIRMYLNAGHFDSTSSFVIIKQISKDRVS